MNTHYAFQPKDIITIAQRIKKGSVGLFPFDTILGITGRMDTDTAIRIRRLKLRDAKKPFIVVAPDWDTVDYLTAPLTSEQKAFLHQAWPGPITCILKKSPYVSDEVTSGLDTVAIRLPEYLPLNFLLECVKQPLISTSANFSGQPMVDEVDPELVSQMDFNLVGCAPIEGLPSTLLDCTQIPPRVIRKGAGYDAIAQSL